MGVDVRKQIITGAIFTYQELGETFIGNFVETDGIDLIGLDNYGEKILPEFIIGVVEESLSGDGDRAQSEKPELVEIDLIPDSQTKIADYIQKLGFDISTHPVKTYRTTYFS